MHYFFQEIETSCKVANISKTSLIESYTSPLR